MKPDFTPKYDWPIKTRVHARVPVPYAYMINPENELEMLPNWEVIRLIEIGLAKVDQGSSYREVADWLVSQTGKSISYAAVSKWWHDLCSNDPNSERAKKKRKLKRKNGPKTPAERAAYEAERKLRGAKRSLTVRQRKLEEIEAVTKPKQPEPEYELGTITEYTEEIDLPENRSIGFKPNKGPQERFLAASEQEVLYGGSAGGKCKTLRRHLLQVIASK